MDGSELKVTGRVIEGFDEIRSVVATQLNWAACRVAELEARNLSLAEDLAHEKESSHGNTGDHVKVIEEKGKRIAELEGSLAGSRQGVETITTAYYVLLGEKRAVEATFDHLEAEKADAYTAAEHYKSELLAAEAMVNLLTKERDELKIEAGSHFRLARSTSAVALDYKERCERLETLLEASEENTSNAINGFERVVRECDQLKVTLEQAKTDSKETHKRLFVYIDGSKQNFAEIKRLREEIAWLKTGAERVKSLRCTNCGTEILYR